MARGNRADACRTGQIQGGDVIMVNINRRVSPLQQFVNWKFPGGLAEPSEDIGMYFKNHSSIYQFLWST